MVAIEQRIKDLDRLGRFMAQYEQESGDADLQRLNEYFLEGYRQAIAEAQLFNPWFSEENLHFALEEWSRALQANVLQRWLEQYPQDLPHPQKQKRVALIMAGNVPLVGFHDLISVLLSGHKVLAKPSSDDDKLMPFLAQVLVAIDKDLAPQLAFADGKLQDFDAVIATGNNNSARYFEYYFGKYPHIIRQNRSSVAVLNGEESKEQLRLLAEDIFRYFGLGCRNVSKAYVPKDFDVNRLFEASMSFEDITNHNKYSNNYDYNRAIYLMEKIDFMENGVFIIREHEPLQAPVGVLHVERYSDGPALKRDLEVRREELQCVVSQEKNWPARVDLGESQRPQLWDYADGVDTLAFLQDLGK